ncbi:hypothetical protein JYU02_00960 [bacterium AH-315-P15]|nr:hypothetical protein [bacterium AH-315-P15]
MSATRFALATARSIHENGPAEDGLIFHALRKKGAGARAIVWDETAPVKLNGEVAVIRTTWNY